MILKVGSKGKEVKELQEALEINIDGDFGYGTEAAVKSFQKENDLYVDGIVGNKTWEILGIDTDEFPKELKYMSTDLEKSYMTSAGLTINRQYLDKDEYVRDYGKIEPLGFFIHHTAGWDNPYKTIRHWNNDTRGRVATQYVIGGSNIKGNTKYDGEVVECFPNNYLGWHLGKVGNFAISKFSGGVELNNFGYLKEKDGKFFNYVNVEVPEEMVCDLGYEFRGFRYWHAYTTKQIESLRLLILHLKNIYPKMDLENGLPELLKGGMDPKDAFEFNDKAYNAEQFGLWTHTNVRKDKFDCSPQPLLVEMLITI
jgi:N-acetyl-anhydromuramyl-L-alanine amidase AmpD|tara:strand:+ start:1363 stop:2298 length:936 start_codon:yes stop_codon:yes gene_type:complete